MRFVYLASPVAVLANDKGHVSGVRFVRNKLGEPDKSGRRRPVAIKDSEFDLECDTVVVAIGTNANPIIGETSHVRLNDRGYIVADEDLATSIDGVFAGGDIVTGAATVIEAMGAGRAAARAMKRYLGLVDSAVPYEGASPDGTLFGLAPEQREYARVRVG
jgi:glutamate synthase (NADPH/NADH) small chain